MKSSESIAKLAPALVKAINAIEGVKKGADNPFFKSKYANLESVIEASHEALSANGLAVMQGPGPMDGSAITLTTRIIHESGEWIETDFSLPAKAMDPQAAGSAITYARRYSLMAMLNMPAVDDDGEGAMTRTDKTAKRDTGPGPVEGKDWWKAEGPGMTAHAAKKDGWDDRHEQMRSQIDGLSTAQGWRDWCAENSSDIKLMPKTWRMTLREEAEIKGIELGALSEEGYPIGV